MYVIEQGKIDISKSGLSRLRPNTSETILATIMLWCKPKSKSKDKGIPTSRLQGGKFRVKTANSFWEQADGITVFQSLSAVE